MGIAVGISFLSCIKAYIFHVRLWINVFPVRLGNVGSSYVEFGTSNMWMRAFRLYRHLVWEQIYKLRYMHFRFHGGRLGFPTSAYVEQ